jgi:Acyl-CoA synthetases (AMP-forming)/AMP-acid ligases II
VLWRQHDIFMTSFGGRNLMTGEPTRSLDELVGRVAGGTSTKLMILPPLIHGAAQWSVMTAISMGQTVVFPAVVDHLDADDVVRTIEREKVMTVTVVGDAIARPLVAAIEKGIADVSSLAVVANGGALLTPYVKQRLIDVLPNAIIIDGVGSSETGARCTTCPRRQRYRRAPSTPDPIPASPLKISGRSWSRATREWGGWLNAATFRSATKAMPRRLRPPSR